MTAPFAGFIDAPAIVRGNVELDLSQGSSVVDFGDVLPSINQLNQQNWLMGASGR